jgi:hypothetical protein
MPKLFRAGMMVMAAALAGPALASGNSDVTGSSDIVVTGKVASMEAAARLSPWDGGALSDLANAYLTAGRMQDAMMVYRRVLAIDNVMLESRNGDAIWSHEVARTVLAQAPHFSSL